VTFDAPAPKGKRYAFLAGLPRSGSTLFAAILRQNPRLHADMSSPVQSLMAILRKAMSHNPELNALMEFRPGSRERILRGVMESYHAGNHDKQVIFDTSRAWTGRMDGLVAMYPDARVIALVRDPAWVFDSLERITHKDPYKESLINQGATMSIRAKNAMEQSGIIGQGLGHLRDAVYGHHADKLMLVEYDTLCTHPKQVMERVYDFIGEPHFAHDFNHVEYSRNEFDEVLNTPGLHTVTGAVKLEKRKTILPPEIFGGLSQTAFWRTDLPEGVQLINDAALS